MDILEIKSQVEAYGSVLGENFGKWSKHGSRNPVPGFFFSEENRSGYKHRIPASKFNHFPGSSSRNRWLSYWFLPQSRWNQLPESLNWDRV
jgi:hypothetical protein